MRNTELSHQTESLWTIPDVTVATFGFLFLLLWNGANMQRSPQDLGTPDVAERNIR